VTRLVEISVDEAVLVRARAGDAGAQQLIYTAVAPATLTLIRRFVGHAAISEDRQRCAPAAGHGGNRGGGDRCGARARGLPADGPEIQTHPVIIQQRSDES
jgi:hypothetical protein